MIHLYWGDGKGKTTAAVGLAVRALGAGLPVAFAQFKKSRETGELRILRSLAEHEPLLLLRPKKQYPFFRDMTEHDKSSLTAEHNRMLAELSDFLDAHSTSEDLPLVVLDELTWAMNYRLIDEQTVLQLLDSGFAEVAVTGRNPGEVLHKRADYSTEMLAERHPYSRGIPARRGIEF